MNNSTGKVKLTRFILSKSELRKMSSKDRKRYIMFTFILRDLNLLQKCLIYSKNDNSTERIIDSANTVASLFFIKTLISKIYEMWVFLKENILSDQGKFSLEIKESINQITSFFSDDKILNIFGFIRNKIGFHYEYQNGIDPLIDKAFDELRDNEFEMWLSESDSGNDIFVSSNTLTIEVILKQMGKFGFQGSDMKRMDELFALSLKASSLFRNFSAIFLAEAFKTRWEQRDRCSNNFFSDITYDCGKK